MLIARMVSEADTGISGVQRGKIECCSVSELCSGPTNTEVPPVDSKLSLGCGEFYGQLRYGVCVVQQD